MANNIGSKLDALRNKRREEEEEEQKKAANVGASLDALRNKRQTEDIPSFKEALYNEKGFLQNQAARSASAEIPDITTPAGKQSVTSMIDRTLPRPGQKISAVDAPLATPTKTEKNLGTYGLQNFGAGFLSGATSGVNAAENVITDVVTGGERSREMKKIDDYLKTDRGAYDALMSGDPLTEAPTRANIAKKAGVSESAVKSYKTQGTPEYWKTEADDWAEENELNAVTKFFLGEAAYQIGMQAPGMMLGAATPFGQSSSSLVESVVDSVKGKSGKDLLKAFGKGTVSGLKSAAKGNTTTWIMAANSAGSKFFENQRLYGDEVSVTANILDSAANGFLESFTEGLGGFSDLPSVGRVLESTVGSKSGTIMRTGLKALLGMVEEGAEEIINVPLGGLADKMTVDLEKKWFGDGGVFDGKEMLVSGMQGALIGGLMGGAGVVAAVNSALAKPDTTKTENAWTANRLADTMNPSEIQLATEMLNREAERFGVEKLDTKKVTREDIENTSAQILDKIIEVKDADILSRRDQLIDYALSAPTDSETYRVGQTLAANPEAVTARDLGYLVHTETERIKQAEASVPAEAVAQAESLVPPDATQTEAQVITTDVQNKVRGEAVQRENVSAENGGATVISELTQKIKNVAPKANIQTAQKLVDAVHLVQTGTMPDKSYNEALNLLRDERVLRTVAAEVGGDFAVDTKNKTTIRASLEAVAKRYAETAEQADMDSLSEEISHAVATLPNYQSPARSASDAITVEGGQITRAEFVRNYGAALAQQGRAADDVFDNLLAAEQTPNAEVNAPIQAAEMPAMMSAAPNADVNAINREANTFEHEANAPIQSAEQGTPAPNADANAFNREANTFERDVNTPIQAAENDVSRETISPNATERGVHRLFSEKTPLTEIQRESVQALEMLSRAVNVDIYLYDSAVDSEYGYSSGRYDTRTDRVYVDINAGAHYEGTILRTAGHELTHYLKRWSPEGFEDLSAFVEMTLTESGADIAALMEGKKANALKHGNELSDDIAYEEVIADACQMLLTDSDALYRLSEQNKTLFERVMDFFREFLDNLRSVYSGYKPTTEAGRIMAAQTQDVMDMLSEVYSDALIRAGKARTEAQKMISGEQSIFADAKTEQGSDLFDYRAMQADMGRYEQMLTEWGGMSEKDVSRLMAMIGHTVDVVRENAQKLDYGYDTDPNAERPFNPVKPNSDKLYKISIDFSTLCRKRIVQSIVAQNLEAALERPLSREEAIKVREALAEVQREGKQIEVACALCYVEAARLKTPAQIQKFMDNRASVLYNHFAEQDRATKDAINEAERAKKVELGYDPKAAVKGKDKNAVRDAKAAARKTYQLTDAQKAEIAYAESLPVTAFTTAKGLTELAENHHDIYKAYADAVRAASHSKGLESDVPWRAGDSEADITDGLIRRMNEGAGVRSQSWSDFQAIHLLDELAMTVEMATRGAKMHSYTKVPDYVRLLGKTGHMINMSLIPTRDGEGFDPSEGMPYETMLLLRDQYPDHAGNICIGVNDEQILRLLDSDEIDYVIPYHKSGNSKATRKLLKIPEWSDYEGIQGEKGDGEKPVFRDWFDLDRARETAARENASPTDPAAKEKYGVQYGAYKAMQEAADRYLQICAERGLTPKFKGKIEGRNVDFTTHLNYWKLLIDRKMVNQTTGEVIEQKPVQPIFDPAVIYGDPADGNVGGILGRALEYYDVHQADTAYAVETVTRAMAENKDTEIGQELSGKQKILNQIIGDSVKAIQDGGVLFEYRGDNIGYHAGDLGKSEFYHMQGGGRGTGHFGTGTYFVGNESQIGEGSGYESRPHHAANFSAYNLYKVRDGEDGRKLHRDLKAIDAGFPKRFLSAAEKDDFRVSELRSEAWNRSEKYDTTHYDADLGFEVSDDFIGAETRGFTEVANENGVPVLSYDEWLVQQGEDVPKQGDSDYDFYKSDYLAYLKETLNRADEEANNGYEDFRDAYFNLKLRFGTDNVNRALRAVLDHDKVMMPDGEFDYWSAYDKRADSRATVFMKALGYEGIDVRGTSLDNTEYGSVIYDLKPEDVLYDLRVNPESAPSASQRDIASSPEFEAFVMAYDAVHGEGAARTIVRTTEQFDRERARQRKREKTAAQMARLPETEAKLRRMAEAAERSRKDESKINAIKNPAVRRAKLSAHLAKQEAEAIRRVAEIDAQMRVADQAYRDNVEMQDRLAEQKARAEERLRGVKADYQERLDRERVRTAQAKFEGKQNASERVQRERYKQWWRNRIHEEDLRQVRAEGRENVRQAREEERARAAERAKEVRDYRAFRNRNADVISEQRQNRHNTYPTGEGAIGNMVDRKQASYNAHAAADQAAFEQEYLAGQASAASRTGAAYVPGAPDTEIKPYLSTADTSATPPGNTFKPVPTKTGKVVEAVKGLPEKAQHAASEVYRLMVNSAQPLDDIAKKQEKAGFLATASDYVTSARNAPAVASYIISEGLTDKSGNPIGKSLADVVLVHGADDVTFNGETVTAQRAFQDYLLHKHNVDRMSFTVRAKQDLDALIKENPWIPDFVDETTSEFTRELYGLSEEQREIVARWADLNRRFREAKDKPIFPAENDTVWTAEQSQARVELYEREQPWMKDKAEDLYQWWDTFMREYAVGVSITAEEYEAMRTLYPHYVPTYREGKSIGKSTNAVAGSVSAGKAVHEAKGGTSEVRWIQDTLAEQVTKIVGLQKQNELLLNLVDSAMLDSDGTMFPGLRVTPKSMGYSTLMTAEDLDNADHQMQTLSKNPDGTYTVTAWDNGNRVSVYVSEDVYNALFSMFGQKSKGYQLALTAGRKLSTPMKSMITGYNPAFGVRNVVRDVATGLIQAEGGTLSGMGSYAANYVRAWNQIASGSDAWNAFKAQGGAGSTHYRAEDGLSSHAEKMLSPTFAGRVKDLLGWFNETSESAARFAAYLQYLKAHGDTPENRIRAIHSAAEITTDFSRSGDIGKLLNAWVPYSNAATQGVDRVLRDFTHGKAVNRLTRTAIVQGIPAAILGLVVKGLGREDEYDEISDYHKDNYYLIPIPDGKWIRLPKTPFYGTLLTSGVSRAVEGVLGREDPFDGFGATAAEAFNLPGAGSETLPEAASSVVRDVVGIGPMLDLFMNKNFIGQDIIPSEFKDYSSGTYAPNNTQYNDETSAIAMVLSKMMLSAVSPIQMDYLMKSYMGDFYHGIASIVDVGLLRSFTAEDLGKNLFDATLGETGSSFVVDPVYSNRYTGEYYDMLDEMSAQITADKNRMPEGEYKNTRTYLTKKAIEDKYGKDISAAYKTARSAVSEAQKRDAREEAVRLSIEALDFYERAMAGKYGSDPAKYVDYEPYGDDVCEALLKLTPYEEEYSFEPNDSYAPSSLTVNKVKYELTAEQRGEYKAMYVSIYADLARQVISTTEYRTVGDRKKAEMLEAAASDAREETTSRMKEILTGK